MNKNKKNNNLGLLLVLMWLLFILLCLIFYFYFAGKLKKDKKDADTDDKVTKFQYQTNANIDINALIGDYYNALVNCNQEGLKALVTDETAYDDMSYYEQQAAVITNYSNINCYSVPGYTEDATLVYVTSNITIAGIDSTPMDIQTFYVRKISDYTYKIDNGMLDDETKAYINEIQKYDDIQQLYKTVRDNIENCRKNDPDFDEFVNKVSEE